MNGTASRAVVADTPTSTAVTTNAPWPTANAPRPAMNAVSPLEQQRHVADQAEHGGHHERGAGPAVDRPGRRRQRHQQHRGQAAW